MWEFLVKPNSEELSVKVIVNLTDYCQACYELSQAKKSLSSTASSKLDPALEAQFKSRRKEIYEELNGIGANLYWQQVTEELHKLCNLADENEALLAQELYKKGNCNTLAQELSKTGDCQTITLELLNKHFIELLKNSVDATVKQYLHQPSDKALLQMRISIHRPVSPESVKITIIDNKGGFPEGPEGYIETFNAFKRKREQEPQTLYTGQTPYLSEKKDQANPEENKYYCGGAGNGLQALCADIYQTQQSSMMIANTAFEKGLMGAEITLTSPLTSIKQQEQQCAPARIASPTRGASSETSSEASSKISPGRTTPLASPHTAQIKSPQFFTQNSTPERKERRRPPPLSINKSST